MSDVQSTASKPQPQPTRLRDALRKARIEAADRTGVVVELRDAEVARLEILNEALDPLFAQVPEKVDLFDRGVSQGETPRLWIDVVAHILMGRDKRIYRFVQDTRFGRIVLAESHDVPVIVDAVTDYVARRMIEREHAMVATPDGRAGRGRDAAPRRLRDVRARLPARRRRPVRPRAVRELAEPLARSLKGHVVSAIIDRQRHRGGDRLVIAASLYGKWLTLRRAEFIRTFRWPRGLLQRLEQHHPGFQRKDSALVSRGLRQFFLAYLMSGKRYVSMPSQVADDLWHEFILYTREYDAFCRRAFGGFLHHTPAVVLSEHRKSNEGLRRVWWYCCKYENIDPVRPTPAAAAICARQQVQYRQRLCLSPRLRGVAQERQRHRLLRR